MPNTNLSMSERLQQLRQMETDTQSAIANMQAIQNAAQLGYAATFLTDRSHEALATATIINLSRSLAWTRKAIDWIVEASRPGAIVSEQSIICAHAQARELYTTGRLIAEIKLP